MTKIELTHDIKRKFDNKYPSVRVTFDPNDYHFDADTLDWLPTHSEILEILRCMALFEDMRYPIDEGFKGRFMLFDEIKKVFE